MDEDIDVDNDFTPVEISENEKPRKVGVTFYTCRNFWEWKTKKGGNNTSVFVSNETKVTDD